jgi:hypothetical protein
MPIELHPACRARLVEVIAERLRSMLIRSNHHVDFDTSWPLADANKVLPANINDLLSDYIDDLPLYSFAVEYLRALLRQRLKYDAEAPDRVLTELLGTEATDLAQQIVDGLCALPKHYQFALQLNRYLSAALRPLFNSQMTITINPTLSLVCVDKEYKDRFAMPPPSLGLLGLAHRLELGEVILVINDDGFVSEFASTRTVARAISALKSFIGLGLATGLFEEGSIGTPIEEFSGPERPDALGANPFALLHLPHSIEKSRELYT